MPVQAMSEDFAEDSMVVLGRPSLEYLQALKHGGYISNYYRYIYSLPITIILQNDLPDLAVAFYCIDIKLPDRFYSLGG